MEATGATQRDRIKESRLTGDKSQPQFQLFSPFSDRKRVSAATCDCQDFIWLTEIPGGIKWEVFNRATVIALKGLCKHISKDMLPSYDSNYKFNPCIMLLWVTGLLLLHANLSNGLLHLFWVYSGSNYDEGMSECWLTHCVCTASPF